MAAFVSRYARAFLDVVTAAHLDTTQSTSSLLILKPRGTAVRNCRRFLRTRLLPQLQKVAILDKLNAKLGLQKELRNLLAVLINNDRIGACARSSRSLSRRIAASGSAFVQAEIVTARELGDDERNALIAGVGKLAGARIEADFKLDQSILGGAVVRIGSTVYDGSVRGRLERLKEVLMEG